MGLFKKSKTFKKNKTEIKEKIKEKTVDDYYVGNLFNHMDYIMAIGQAFVALHEGKIKKTKKFIKRTWKGLDKKSLATKGGLAVAGAGAGLAVTTALTGGAALAAVVGIAIGKWVVGKMFEKVRARNRLKKLRNWSEDKCLKGHFEENEKAVLSTLAKDAFRRAVDHFRKAQYLEKTELDIDELLLISYQNCENAVAHALIVAKFLHEVNKAAMYLIPSIDIVKLSLKGYREFIELWNSKDKLTISTNLAQLLLTMDHSNCKGQCFRGLLNPGFDLDIFENFLVEERKSLVRKKLKAIEDLGKEEAKLRKKLKDADEEERVRLEIKLQEIKDKKNRITKNLSRFVDRDLTKVEFPSLEKIDSIIKRVEEMESWLDIKDQPLPSISFPKTPQESTKFPIGGIGPDSGTKERMMALLNDVLKKVDKPGIITKVAHKFKNWHTRKTALEKGFGLLSDSLSLGLGVFSPFLQAGSNLPAQAINLGTKAAVYSAKAGITAGNMAVDLGGKKLADKRSQKKSVTSEFEIPMLVYDNLKHEGVKVSLLVEDIILDVAMGISELASANLYFNNLLVKATKKPSSVTCADVWDGIRQLGRALNNFSKMEIRLNVVLNVMEFMCGQIRSWYNIQRTLWKDLQEKLRIWLSMQRFRVHFNVCQKKKKICYAPNYSGDPKVPFKRFS